MFFIISTMHYQVALPTALKYADVWPTFKKELKKKIIDPLVSSQI